MSVLCYNCRGLGEHRAVANLRRIIRSCSPRVVFLSETKKLESEMRRMIQKFGEYGGVFVDCAGRSEGLAMLWHTSLKLSLLSKSLHHIDIIVERWEGVEPWSFTGVYGWAERGLKINTCVMMKDLSPHSELPWLVGGDFNEVFYNYEKSGGAAKNQVVLDTFCATFEECGLCDLGYSGYAFTWDNRRADSAVVEERLDWFCGSLEWSLLFPEAEVLHLDEHQDHLPILLRTQKTARERRKLGRGFRFKNM